MQNTTTLNNSDRILLLPKDYSRVWNGEDLYSEMYHADGRRDIQMYQNLAERSGIRKERQYLQGSASKRRDITEKSGNFRPFRKGEKIPLF